MHLTLPHKARGLTLIEIVLTALILGSCIIGIAAIYTQRQDSARGGQLHEQAVMLAQQLAAQMRSRPGALGGYETRLGVTCDQPQAKAMTQKDVDQVVACWADQVSRELTNGNGRVSLDRSLVPAQYLIIVSWSEPRSGTASYVLRVTPPAENPAQMVRKNAARAVD